ncbi:MAG: insulinase family protein [Clostridium sp.]|jgi:predicted Zn-dependent peptidase|uniref:M16 family metallopeptidase n=1 Tax=Clostridium sp. TaxID=1506 RepID=UPI0025C3692B|nr:pitrilysin family protein [Clostridium sp.]MCH3964353.1 insulinase family protein [Clostridium sp.]MCI1715528.1 insulinase family protein [Clostridium sp.]MCI1799680.1 insulinase family protein [Clostridium sp.]MCI1813712.1 insulinase family protein [Clostridium sp.]MCI1870493.1 insulinase family protein [Clostridium sp.]
MEYFTLKNGMKIIYEHREGQITSLCIGFNAGALDETGRFAFGTAHALEHMISKGTINRTENDINNMCDSIFGFENAMTNYPYTVYYGSCLNQDVERAVELYSDMLLNPLFPEGGFEGEMDVISQELREWKDDPYQCCEDLLFMNSFKNRRIKETIIGSKHSIKTIELQDIVDFYSSFYVPSNCVVSFSSSLDFEHILNLMEHYFQKFKDGDELPDCRTNLYEVNLPGIYESSGNNTGGAKIQYIFDISDLNFREFKALMLFNCAFGQGTGSFLFDRIRTENAAAYEIGSSIKNETGIKLLSIKMGTSAEKIHSCICSIDNVVENIKNGGDYFSEDVINDLSKRIKIKRALKAERSVQLCKELTTCELMHGSFTKFDEEIEDLDAVSTEEIYSVIDKVMNNPSIQIFK